MIASRIWYLNAQSARYNSHMSSLHPVARIVVESGAIYSSLLIILLILYSRKSWLEYVFIDAVSHLSFFFVLEMLKIDLPVVPNHCKKEKNSQKCMIFLTKLLNTGNRLFGYHCPYRTWN